jgi:hypothetical protein
VKFGHELLVPGRYRSGARRKKARRDEYATKSVVTGPEGKGYTQYELDRLSADEYRRVMRLCGDRQPRFSNVMRPER